RDARAAARPRPERGLPLLDGHRARLGHDPGTDVDPVRAAGVLPVPGAGSCGGSGAGGCGGGAAAEWMSVGGWCWWLGADRWPLAACSLFAGAASAAIA